MTTAFARFHRDVLVPEVERIVGESEERITRRFNAHFDSVYQRLDRLETEYQMLVVGLKQVEDRLDTVEARLDGVEGRLDRIEERMALRSEVDGLKEKGLFVGSSG